LIILIWLKVCGERGRKWKGGKQGRFSSVVLSVFFSSHGMRRETTCNHISLALFCLMERNLLSASYMCVIIHPYTGCIEPGVN